MAVEISESRASSPMDDETRMGGTGPKVKSRGKPKHKLDSGENVNLYHKIMGWYDYEFTAQAPNRYQMALDCDYYDSMQWSEEDAQVLINRGQAPLVFNEVKSTIDWMIGTERRTRIDHKVLPRRDDKGAQEDAENKSQLLKYLSDVNKTPFQHSFAFESASKAGVGWIETGIRGDESDELLYTRNEDWRNCLHDSKSVEADASDMRYFFRQRILDEDIAIAYFPDRADIIKQAVVNGDSFTQDEDDEEVWYMGARVTPQGQDYANISNGRYQPYMGSSMLSANRSRVKLRECWYKQPKLVRKFNSGEYEGEMFDSSKQEHIEQLKRGESSLYDKLVLEVRCAIFCKGGLLYDGESPYKHKRIPFVPVWCYRKGRDNMPYGMIRALRDAQDDLNKRRSKAQWILSTNGVTMDEGAVDDIEELREEITRPDYIIVKKAGKELTKDRDIAIADQHLQLMEYDKQYIRSVGVNDDNMGRKTNASSGIAITARQEQGSVATTAPFDNLRFAVQLVGEMELANVEQFYTQEKIVRIIGERGGVKFKRLNQPGPDGEILNDITKFQADFIISEQDYRSSLRQAMFESLFDIVGKLGQFNPQVALNLLDLVVEMADLPNKEELVNRIRKLNGQSDPDKEESDEEMIQKKAQEAKETQFKELQEKLMLRDAEAKTAKTEAETAKLNEQVNALQVESMNKKLDAMYVALQAAGISVENPAIAPTADVIMKDAGYKSKTQEESELAQQAQAQQMQEAQAQPAPQDMQQAQVQDVNAPGEGARAGIETPDLGMEN
ncbi:MAG: hypothetical protein WC733_00090 [Methylophilus sp.]|jgi:hypothetical protein